MTRALSTPERRLVVTIGTGSYRKIGRIAIPSQQLYAERIGAEFLHITKNASRRELKKLGFKWKLGPWWWFHAMTYPAKLTKARFAEFLNDYDRLIYLDCTCLVHPDCPDLFDLVPSDQLGVVIEPVQEETLQAIYDHYQVEPADQLFFNAGMQVVSSGQARLYSPPEVPVREFKTFLGQPWENAMRHRFGIPIHQLDRSFNVTGGLLRRFDKRGEMAGDPAKANIVHMTGGYAPGRMDLRIKRLKEIRQAWYGD